MAGKDKITPSKRGGGGCDVRSRKSCNFPAVKIFYFWPFWLHICVMVGFFSGRAGQKNQKRKAVRSRPAFLCSAMAAEGGTTDPSKSFLIYFQSNRLNIKRKNLSSESESSFLFLLNLGQVDELLGLLKAGNSSLPVVLLLCREDDFLSVHLIQNLLCLFR